MMTYSRRGSGCAEPLSPYDASLSQFPTYAKKWFKTGCSPIAGGMCEKQRHFTRLEFGEHGELVADGSVVHQVDESRAHISMMETLLLLESRKQDYSGIARLGIEALELKIKGSSIKEIAQMYGAFRPLMWEPDLPVCGETAERTRIFWTASDSLLKIRCLNRKEQIKEVFTMTLRTLFTAVGRLEKRTGGPGKSYPVIVLGGKDYMVDLQEMLVWTSLNWRIIKREEIGELYGKAVLDYSFTSDRTWSCLRGPSADPGAANLRKRRD